MKEWTTANEAWRSFVREHPELGYRDGRWPFYNFLRLHKQHLVDADAIRWAKNRFWIANVSRFSSACFDAVTNSASSRGADPTSASQQPHSVTQDDQQGDAASEALEVSCVPEHSALLAALRVANGACLAALRMAGAIGRGTDVQRRIELVQSGMRELDLLLQQAMCSAVANLARTD